MKTSQKEIINLVVFVLLVFFCWSAYDNGVYFGFFESQQAEAATQSGTSTLNVIIGPSITFTIDGTCDNDTSCDTNSTASFGTIAAGAANDANVRVKSVSNDTVILAVGRDRSNPATTLASAAQTSINISDTNGGIDVFTGCTTPVTQTWKDASSTGLGFSLWAATAGKDETCWGTGTSYRTSSADANKYAALQASVGASTAWTSTAAGTTYASIGFTLDVSGSQQATTYAGEIVFTGTTTP